MEKISISNYSLADSAFKSLEIDSENNLTVKIISWEEKIIKFIFKNILFIEVQPGYFIMDFYEIKNICLSDYIISLKINFPGNLEKLKLYQLVDIDDFVFIKIVAESVESSIDIK